MRPFWHPLSTILLSNPRCFATDGLVRMLLATEGRAELIYAGDRMWPTVAHGDPFTVTAPDESPPAIGETLLVSRDGIPDLLRVAAASDTRLRLTADAEPDLSVDLPPGATLGRAQFSVATPARGRSTLRRLALDLREAWTGSPDPRDDPADTVLEKYDSQAGYYAQADTVDIDPPLLERVRRRVAPGRSLLVVGSGAGRECFALAAAGWQVEGVEFSRAMVALSVAEAQRRKLDVAFRRADIRDLELDTGSVGCVFFTYDVFSFLPQRRARVELLRRLRRWLDAGGVVFVSARLLLSAYDRLILTVEWLAQQRRADSEWGDSHTRWIPQDGGLRRSFVHVFTPHRLRAEAATAGFRLEDWQGGHGVLVPALL